MTGSTPGGTIDLVTVVATAGGLPARLGKYEIMMPLAAGGMARIYIARTTGIGSFERHVVLKLITPERANDHTAVQMFLDEARLAASLNHQNVAQVFEVGEDAGIHYLAMEYVHGQDLRALLAKAGSQGTRVPLELALTAVTGAAAGLNHAHERRGSDGVPLGIVHRDVSPSNIMIGYDGSVKLLDFGIAKATARSIETQSGIIKGKFAYMAPEQCRGRDVDRRSDVFSLGIILYEITTQHRCFRADSDFDTMHRIVTGDVVRPTRLVQGYPQALEAIVMKALAVDAAQRYQSASALLEAIEAFATSARMSLSMMSLGRFMREMFGDQTEPWLRQDRHSPPLIPRESTISNTNGTGREQMGRPMLPLPAPDSGPIQAPSAILDLPRHERRDDADANAVDWNAKSYPTIQPAYASNGSLPPELDARPSSPELTPIPPTTAPSVPLPGMPPTRVTTVRGYDASAAHRALTMFSAGAPDAGQFPAVPGSGSHSGPAHGAIPSTRHGYASAPGTARGDVADADYDFEAGFDDGADLQLAPNRRPLFIGLGIAAVGVVILLMTLGGGKDDSDKEEPTVSMNTGSELRVGSGSAAHDPTAKPAEDPTTPSTATANRTGSGSAEVVGSVVPAAVKTSIKLHVTSNPAGADVILAGKVIGQTPLSTKLPRGTGMTMITVHKAKFIDTTKEFDRSEDYESDLTLRKAEPKPTAPDVKQTPEIKRTPEVKKTPEIKKTPEVKSTNTTPPKPACQPPAQYDPTDSRPPCK